MHITTPSTPALSRCSSKSSRTSDQSNNTRGIGETASSQTTATSAWSTVKSNVSLKAKSRKAARSPTLDPPPAQGPPLSISHLTADEKQLYASILTGPCKNHPPPGEASPQPGSKQQQHAQQKASLLLNLPHHLKNPKAHSSSGKPPTSPLFKNIFKRTDAAFPPSPPPSPSLPTPSPLCPLHTPLNPHIVASALTAVEMHIEDYLDDLVRLANPRRLTAEILALAAAAEDVMALRLSRDEFHAQYGRSAWRRFQDAWTDGCGACALTLVGASPEVVACLRAVSVLGAEVGLEGAGMFCASAGEWFDAWMGVRGDGEREEIGAMSDQMVGEFRRVLGCGEVGSMRTGKDGAASTLASPRTPLAPRRSSKRPNLCPSPLRIHKDPSPPTTSRASPSSPPSTPPSLLSPREFHSPASSATSFPPTPLTPPALWTHLPPMYRERPSDRETATKHPREPQRPTQTQPRPYSRFEGFDRAVCGVGFVF